MRISDWSSDVFSSDLVAGGAACADAAQLPGGNPAIAFAVPGFGIAGDRGGQWPRYRRWLRPDVDVRRQDRGGIGTNRRVLREAGHRVGLWMGLADAEDGRVFQGVRTTREEILWGKG